MPTDAPTRALESGGWQIKGSNSSGTASTRAIINRDVVLNPGCHYLLTNSSSNGGPYSGSVAGIQTYGVGITDDGGIALTSPDGTIVDRVGMSSGSAFKEGTTRLIQIGAMKGGLMARREVLPIQITTMLIFG